MTTYDNVLVQLQDGRELYLEDVEWKTVLEGTDYDTGNEVIVDPSNIAVIIPNISHGEFQDHKDGVKNLITDDSRWDE